MIVVDTNVLSEPMRPKPDANVLAWFERQDPAQLYFTTVGYSEILVGLAWMPDGKRKRTLEAQFELLVELHFGGRILAFDIEAAMAAAQLVTRTRSIGYNLTREDGQIAAIAAARGFAVATRDTRPFEMAGLTVINPWNDGA